MSSSIQDWYESRAYPAMSHPLSDPAVSAVAAALAGVRVPHPAAARILEIGCGSGLNLIPLALRWPASRLVGIDLAGPAIQAARELAAAAGVTNIEFQAVDLRDFRAAGGGFDFIIAHGFLSWVPDEVKAALFRFCAENLTSAGIATISFNLASGWLPRLPVIAKVRAIRQAGAADEMGALRILRSVTAADSPEIAVIDDMLAKGPAILAFDDFGPINDPWPLDHFVNCAAAAGLRWLGESHPGNNRPAPSASPECAQARDLAGSAPADWQFLPSDPLAWHLAADASSGRTFRSAVLCHAAAGAGNGRLERLLETPLRLGPRPLDQRQHVVYQALAARGPECVPLSAAELAAIGGDRRVLARQIYGGIGEGWLLPRIEPVRFEVEPAARPALNALRMECVRRGLPLVDIWHQPCTFPAGHEAVLAALDGTRDRAELRDLARRECPELAFDRWLRHLAGRGMFA